MTARLIDGAALSRQMRSVVAEGAARLPQPPGLAVVLVGDDPASAVYVRNKRKQAAEAGIVSTHHDLPVTTTTDELLTLVQALNDDYTVDGILVQLPLPPQVDEHAVLVAVAADKDVDGFHPDNVARLSMGIKDAFVPCTPLGCLRLLDDEDVALKGAHAVVVGRSNIVGKPMAALLLSRDCTVTMAHSKTRDLAAVCRTADVLVAAVGRARMIGRDHVKDGAVVIDVGINRLPPDPAHADKPGKLVGDVDFDAVQGVAAAVTPVPGGVGPMTIAMLLQNTLTAHARHLGI
jgi:methylenetetrahydrofolate dehydrogenase (NADP+)/methenyltetrahydrofolate cyclohydrolase